MKSVAILALASALVLGSMPQVSASAIEDTVRTNCTKELAKSTDATRGEIKTFTIVKHGNGYVMSGRIASGQTVTCKTNADGRVTAIS